MQRHRTHLIVEAKTQVGKRVKVAGWVHDFRDLGKLKFVSLRDNTGIIQVLLKKPIVSEEMLAKAVFNKEDVISFEGEVKENKIAPDGVEIVPDNFEILNKVERKLPVDPTGVVPSELDVRLDYRYIDLRRKEITLLFKIKSLAATIFRRKLIDLGFCEIHPSAISGAATEGGADVFQVQYFERKAFLVQSPQLHKQMAVIGGLDKVMMVVPVFRAEKHNTTSHLNEITQMDIEMGFADHQDAMNMLETIVLEILERIQEKYGHEIEKTFGKLEVPKHIKKYTHKELVKILNEHGHSMNEGEDFTKDAEKKLYEILKEELFFIYDWPTAVRAFYSMPDEKNPEICHAFDLMYRGAEISSGAKRIHKAQMLEEALRKRGLDPNDFEFYLNAFRMGAPPHAGWSIGLERLVLKMCKQDNIRECMLFPRDRNRLLP